MINEVHQRLSHIGHKHLRHLLQKGLVTGIKLDENSKPTFCKSCEWRKKHWKPIQKVQEDPKPKAVSEEVHSDLWRKAPVKTINS